MSHPGGRATQVFSENRNEGTKSMRYMIMLATVAAFGGSPASSGGFCKHRPSELLRGGFVGSMAAGAQNAASTLVAKAGGVFTFTNTVTGASLLGSNAVAGTIGQIGGVASNAASSVAAVPGIALAGATAAIGLAAFEGVCFFRDERITDHDEVLRVLYTISAFADPAYYRIEQPGADSDAAVLVLGSIAGETNEYAVDRLRIVNGVLWHQQRGRDVALGDVGFATLAAPAE